MVNGGDLFICVLAGLVIPLAIVDGLKAMGVETTPRQVPGWQVERRPFVWLFGIVAGPGLFLERMLRAWREGVLSAGDGVNAFVIALGWAALYGFVVLGVVKAVLAI